MRIPRTSMMILLRHVFLYVALLTAVAGLATSWPTGPAAAQDSMRIAAVVNEDVISELDIYMRLRMAMLGAHLEDTPETRDRLVPQVLRNLIDDRLKLQEAKRQNIAINPADVERRIDAIGERNNMTRDELTEFLRGNGILVEALADQINAEL